MHKIAILAFLISLLFPTPPSVGGIDVVASWNAAALDAIRAGRTSPPVASRALAVLHTSIFDAVNGIARRYEQYFVPSRVPASASRHAAASAAAHTVLVTLFPAKAAAFDELHAEILDTIRDHPQERAGIRWGETVAKSILEWRGRDGADAAADLPSHSGPGAWQPTPPGFQAYLLPQWGFVTTFALESPSAVRPPGPPALDSAAWAQDYNEVKELGAATGSARTAEQSVIAQFWADGAGTETPPGHWNSIARDVSERLETPLVEKARLFALLNVALADAAISAWDAKYTYAFWRPVTAIRNGDIDGHDDTVADPAWSSFIVTPPFPDYVSGHSTFSGAAATVLALFYRSDDIAFTAASDVLPGVTRDFNSFSAAAEEAALSRLYGGIHFRSANEDGLRAGVAIGAWTVRNVMRANRDRSRR